VPTATARRADNIRVETASVDDAVRAVVEIGDDDQRLAEHTQGDRVLDDPAEQHHRSIAGAVVVVLLDVVVDRQLVADVRLVKSGHGGSPTVDLVAVYPPSRALSRVVGVRCAFVRAGEILCDPVGRRRPQLA
jgi:hypothetical protein